MIQKIDHDGLILCKMQGTAFEMSYDYMKCSSPMFIRHFVYSDIARLMDRGGFLNTIISEQGILDLVNEQYGISEYGKIKYTKDELFWIGYIYRYYAYTYDITSRQAYKKIKPGDLRRVYPAYTYFSPDQTIERILEAKYGNETELERQYRIFCEIRGRQVKKKS